MLRSSILFLLLALNVSVNAQEKKPFILGRTDEISSKYLSEKRILNIYLPDGYDKDTAHYPVIYLLDGSANEDFIHVVGIVQFLTMIQAMPNTIVVGIANIDRRRDFTFPTKIDSDKKAYPTTGSSAKFISFLGNELEPYIQNHYRTNSFKTIIGQSLGGLVATEILLKRPELFNDYIIVSPSLWWDAESLLSYTPGIVRYLPNRKMNVYISVGTEGPEMEGDARKLVDQLKKYGNEQLNVLFAPLPEENHLTILHHSVYKGLLMLNEKK